MGRGDWEAERAIVGVGFGIEERVHNVEQI